MVGCVGDSLLIGCGGYVNKEGVVLMIGYGELIMKMMLVREVVYNIEEFYFFGYVCDKVF